MFKGKINVLKFILRIPQGNDGTSQPKKASIFKIGLDQTLDSDLISSTEKFDVSAQQLAKHTKHSKRARTTMKKPHRDLFKSLQRSSFP
jgi:hypothetical protein